MEESFKYHVILKKMKGNKKEQQKLVDLYSFWNTMLVLF